MSTRRTFSRTSYVPTAPPSAPILSILPSALYTIKTKEARADRGAINITLNSFGGPLNEPVMRTTDRRRLYPAIGALYPEATNSFQVPLTRAFGAIYMARGPWLKPLLQGIACDMCLPLSRL